MPSCPNPKGFVGILLIQLGCKRSINVPKDNQNEIKEAKKLYASMCVICHGNKGKGDGIAGAALSPKPANFTSKKIQTQTDGAL
ncbi:c-type cytochrome, partial [Lutibacter sp.]